MLAKFLLIFLIAFYVLLAPRFFRSWRLFFEQDTTLSPQERTFSQVVLAIATVFWPVVVPFAYLELLNKVQREKVAAPLQTTLQTAKIAEVEAKQPSTRF